MRPGLRRGMVGGDGPGWTWRLTWEDVTKGMVWDGGIEGDGGGVEWCRVLDSAES
jgi:hypothetical protein